MTRHPRRGLVASAVLFFAAVPLLAVSPGSSAAQGVQSETLPEIKAAPAGKSPTRPATKAPDAAAGAAQVGGDQGLKQRVEQLEEQLVDLQVVIGTLESLAKSGVRPPPAAMGSSGPLSGSDQSRLDGMETQIRALTSQIEQLSSEIKSQGGGVGRRSDAGEVGPPSDLATASSGSGSVATSKFGSTTVMSDKADPIGNLVAKEDAGPIAAGPSNAKSAPVTSPSPPAAASTETAALDAKPSGNPKQLYETAYGYLLQQDYASAQSGFSNFLKTYPRDPLAPNALYWLGESHYVQRNYADAAEAFDLVVSAYGTSNKAADAQLKRGMSLAQLGKKQDACMAFRDLATKFPSAPPLLKSKADGERQRVGCT